MVVVGAVDGDDDASLVEGGALSVPSGQEVVLRHRGEDFLDFVVSVPFKGVEGGEKAGVLHREASLRATERRDVLLRPPHTQARNLRPYKLSVALEAVNVLPYVLAGALRTTTARIQTTCFTRKGYQRVYGCGELPMLAKEP